MFRKFAPFIPFLTGILLVTACSPTSSDAPDSEVANPAAVYCEEQGNVYAIVTNEDGTQSGTCTLPNGSVCDEWEYFHGECGVEDNATDLPFDIATPFPIDPEEYEGWWSYTHPVYNFSIMLPEDWIVQEVTTSDPMMNGHLLMLFPEYTQEAESIRLTFRHNGEDILLFPTGVGEGTFSQQGKLEIGGEAAIRMALSCPSGEVTSLWYQSEDTAYLLRGELEFGFIFKATPLHCESGVSLNGKTQRVGEMIIASLSVP